MSKALYSFFWECGRMGDVDGLFVADKEEVNSKIGKEVYFGEILGKHSDIIGTLEPEDLKILSEDQEKIEWLLNIMEDSTISGYNPLKYIDCDEEE